MTSALNILMIVPSLSYSHISFNSKIADILSSKGHKVLMLIPDIDSSVPSPSGNYTLLREDVGIAPGELTSTLWRNPNPYEDSSPLNYKIFLKLMRVSSVFVRACEALANDNNLMDFLREQKFNVGMLEQYDSCGFGIFRTIGLNSFVWLSATGAYAEQPRTIGIDYPSSYVPNLFAPLSDKMSFAERIENWLISTATRLVFSHTRARESRIFWNTGDLKFGEDLYNTATNSDAVIVNSLPAADFAMPTSNKVAYIGGITVQRRLQHLDTFWKEIADSATKEFVLVTFGSIARTVDMTPEMQSNFFTAFSRFPEITFIVKYESANCTLPIPPNVELTQWIPQAGLMSRPSKLQGNNHSWWMEQHTGIADSRQTNDIDAIICRPRQEFESDGGQGCCSHLG
ncbi:unnamed protein product [Cylicocyclus nassatus]|uniref:glucuronosyltransferase n=1 Tax=Cylicocyclus nassatus TaxID=53992 RepID=A0AA36GZH7_CYLNA|nr:unnamed protein product [Cylicocyclus nassatus]